MRLPLLAASFVLLISNAGAHEDPVGDIHPAIRIEDGKFAVYFQDSTPTRAGKTAQNYRRLIDLDGRVLSWREPVQALPPATSVVFDGLPLDAKAESVGDHGSSRVFFQEPVASILPPGRPDGSLIVSGTISNVARGVFVIDQFRPGEPNETLDWPFSFGAYDPARRAFLPPARIGNPGRIYWPVRSAIRVKGNEALVAWCEMRDRIVEQLTSGDGSVADVVTSTTQVVLSRWEIGGAEVRHVALRQTMNDNMSITMERLGDRVLVAWHDGVGKFGAKIYTQLVDLNTAEFHTTPPLARASTLLDDMKRERRAKRLMQP